MSVAFKSKAPEWYALVPEGRACHWVAGEGFRTLFGNLLDGYLIRVVLKNGEVLAGTTGNVRGQWTGNPAIAIRLTNRKTQKWLPVSTIAEVWSDRGPDASVLIARLLTR